jgi:hypothetical protein
MLPLLTRPQSRPLGQSLLLGLVVLGCMIVGAVFHYFVTNGLLWLERYVRDQYANAMQVSGQLAHGRGAGAVRRWIACLPIVFLFSGRWPSSLHQ